VDLVDQIKDLPPTNGVHSSIVDALGNAQPTDALGNAQPTDAFGSAQPTDAAVATARSALETLHAADELLTSQRAGNVLADWQTLPPTFKPTFKVIPGVRFFFFQQEFPFAAALSSTRLLRLKLPRVCPTALLSGVRSSYRLELCIASTH
jgi:hypothetical protein